MAASVTPENSWDPALLDLYERHFDTLVGTALRAVRSRSLAEEVVHDAFLTFHSRGCQPRAGNELAYLRSMVINRGYSIVRRTRRGEELTLPDFATAAPVEDRCIDRLNAGAVRRAVARLPKRQQQVIALRYGHGYTEAETAEALGISLGSVKTHGSRSREALRVALMSVI